MTCITIMDTYKHQSHIFRNLCQWKETHVCAVKCAQIYWNAKFTQLDYRFQVLSRGKSLSQRRISHPLPWLQLATKRQQITHKSSAPYVMRYFTHVVRAHMPTIARRHKFDVPFCLSWAETVHNPPVLWTLCSANNKFVGSLLSPQSYINSIYHSNHWNSAFNPSFSHFLGLNSYNEYIFALQTDLTQRKYVKKKLRLMTSTTHLFLQHIIKITNLVGNLLVLV